jgi:hydrogenase maturation factor HypF (carbamoyltransferase family)
MSIRYKILRIPRTVEDLADQAKRQGNSRVNIDIRENRSGPYFTDFEVYLQAGKNEKMLARHYTQALVYGAGGLPKMHAEARALNTVLLSANIMENRGLTATINGKPKDSVYKRIDELSQFSKKLKSLGLLPKQLIASNPH